MQQATLAEIKTAVDRLAQVIGADPKSDSMPTYGRTEDSGRPHIEVDSRGYHYVVSERGNENKRITTPELGELLYQTLEAAASSLSSRYAAKHRMAGKDFRRPMFQHEVELMTKISPEWGQRCAARLDGILREHPFVDR